MDSCRKCLLPSAVPGAELDRNRVCRFCRDPERSSSISEDPDRERRAADLEQALSDCRGQSEYDCLVAVSGGKDSIYLLYKLKVEYDLNVLAFTTDVDIPDVAWANIRRTLKKLDIDHVFAPAKSDPMSRAKIVLSLMPSGTSPRIMR